MSGRRREFGVSARSLSRFAPASARESRAINARPIRLRLFCPIDVAQLSRGMAEAAADLVRRGKLIAAAGGGDTVSALNHAGIADDFTFVSTAGGAFLEWMEGNALPGVAALER